MFCVVFFFKQKTAYEMRISDWSSDVCSSYLLSLEGILVAPTSGAPVAKSRMRGREGHLGGRLVAGCSCSVFNSCGSSSPQDGALFDECRFHGHAVVVPRRHRLRGHRHHETLAEIGRAHV